MILYSARAAVAENCRRCGSDNTESAVHPIITVQFAPLVHRACFVSSRQQRQRPWPCNGPCSAHSATGWFSRTSESSSRPSWQS